HRGPPPRRLTGLPAWTRRADGTYDASSPRRQECRMAQPTPPPPPSRTPLTYRSAGLDLDVYDQTLSAMAPLLRRTHTPRVLDGPLGNFGGFASLFSLDFNTRLFARNYRHPVLVSCTDGVGSKLKVAILA